MPTYKALGFTARLTVANLEESLSNVFDLKQGAEQHADADRINAVFAKGDELVERVVGPDGSEHGIIQFLGAQEDLPFFMVEVGQDVRDWRERIDPVLLDGGYSCSVDPSVAPQSQPVGTPPSSLSQTPCDGTPHVRNREPTIPVTPQTRSKKTRQTNEPRTPAAQVPQAGLQPSQGRLDQDPNVKALCLTMDLCHKTFMRRGERNKLSGKDLKVEVFLNGELAAITFINRRAAAVEICNDRIYIHGKRIHRQVEKPWMYDPEVSNGSHSVSAYARWDALQENIKQEAVARGRNKWGDYAPSTDLLRALSKMPLPECVDLAQGMSVIDVVVTAGDGKKDGPEAGYVTGPERMREPQFTIFDPTTLDDPFSDDVNQLEKAAEEASPLRSDFPPAPAPVAPTVSPDEVTPTKPRLGERLPRTASERITADSTLGLDLDHIDLTRKVDTFETARKKGSGRRTLKQRLGDLRQMSPQNREKQLAALREELGQGISLQQSSDNGQMTPSPTKKMKLDATPQIRCDLTMDTDPSPGQFPEHQNEPTIEPVKLASLMEQRPLPYFLPYKGDPDAALFRTRIDMALDAGCEPDGPLISHIIAKSPHHTPPRKTRASALANSPCSIPVKTRFPRTPRKRDSSIPNVSTTWHTPIDPALCATGSPSSKRSTWRGAARTARAWNPAEKTTQQVLEDFQCPESSLGGVVGYSEDPKVQRQIGKARNGEFKEEGLVVGMRFLVV